MFAVVVRLLYLVLVFLTAGKMANANVMPSPTAPLYFAREMRQIPGERYGWPFAYSTMYPTFDSGSWISPAMLAANVVVGVLAVLCIVALGEYFIRAVRRSRK